MLCYVKKDCSMESATFGVVNVSPSPDPMAGELTTFTQQLGDRNIAINALMVDGDPWFCGNDIANALGYARPRNAVRDHVDEEDRVGLHNLGRTDSMLPLEHNEGAQVFISESGVYALIMRGKLKEAKLFQRWVTKDVLPNIRKTGQYTAPQEPTVQVEDTIPSLASGGSAQAQELMVYYQLATTINSSSQVDLQKKSSVHARLVHAPNRRCR